jgi:xanthine dehydrogenase accessory factor
LLVNTFGPEYRMLLIGAGQITEYLATMALFSGFAVTCATRARSTGRPGACPGARVVAEMPDDMVTGLPARPAQQRHRADARPQARTTSP